MYIHISLPDDLHRRLKTVAAKHGISMTTMCADAISAHLDVLEDADAIEGDAPAVPDSPRARGKSVLFKEQR